MKESTPQAMTPELVPAGTPEDMVRDGHTLTKIAAGYQTAVAVQRPRNLDRIVAAMERECEYAGEAFYFQMQFGGTRIEGGSIGLAYALAREWGNCVVLVDDVRETDDAILFAPTFVDLERGVTIQRAFRQRKGGAVHGKFDPERKQEIAFQIGQSKATRNVIFSAVPRWLVDHCIERAKEAVGQKINAEGLVKAGENCVAAFRELGVDEKRLIGKVGKPRTEWTSRDIVNLRGDYRAIKTGEMSVAELFPADAGARAAQTNGAVKLDDVMNAQATQRTPTATEQRPVAAEPEGQEEESAGEAPESPAPPPPSLDADEPPEQGGRLKARRGERKVNGGPLFG